MSRCPTRRFRLGAAVLVACGLGVLGLWWAVAGGGPAGTVRGRVVTSALFFLLAGAVPRLVVGRSAGRRCVLLVPVVAAGPLALGVTGLALGLEGGRPAGDLLLALLYIVGPAGLAALGWVAIGRMAARWTAAGRSRARFPV